MQPEYRFREAAAGDEHSIRDVVYSVLREYGLAPDPEGTDADLADVVSAYGDAGGSFRVVVSRSGRIVGCGGLYPVRDGDCEIRKMYLLPEARGRGLGRRLLEDLIALARQRGFRRVIVETASPLREAISLYRQRGFVPFEHEHLAARCDRAYVLELCDDRH